MLRIALKTPDKSVARSLALTLDMELEMVAVKYPTQVKSPDPKMIAPVCKEALEYKRDHIAAIQSRPPFNIELHRRYNSAYSKLFTMMGDHPFEVIRIGWTDNENGIPQTPQFRTFALARSYVRFAPSTQSFGDLLGVPESGPSGGARVFPVSTCFGF